jgi:RNA helicase
MSKSKEAPSSTPSSSSGVSTIDSEKFEKDLKLVTRSLLSISFVEQKYKCGQKANRRQLYEAAPQRHKKTKVCVLWGKAASGKTIYIKNFINDHCYTKDDIYFLMPRKTDSLWKDYRQQKVVVIEGMNEECISLDLFKKMADISNMYVEVDSHLRLPFNSQLILITTLENPLKWWNGTGSNHTSKLLACHIETVIQCKKTEDGQFTTIRKSGFDLLSESDSESSSSSSKQTEK